MSDSLARRVARGIREQRRRSGLTQLALAERAGLSLRHVSSVELGKREPRMRTLEQVASALGVDPAELFSGRAAP